MTFPLEPERKGACIMVGQTSFFSQVWHISPSPCCQANQIHLKSIRTCRPQTRSHTITFPIRTQPGESIDLCETQHWPSDRPPASGSNHFVAPIIAPGGLRACAPTRSLSFCTARVAVKNLIWFIFLVQILKYCLNFINVAEKRQRMRFKAHFHRLFINCFCILS